MQSKYRGEEISRNERWILNYVITIQDCRMFFQDVKVNRSAEIPSGHYLVVAKLIINEVARYIRGGLFISVFFSVAPLLFEKLQKGTLFFKGK